MPTAKSELEQRNCPADSPTISTPWLLANFWCTVSAWTLVVGASLVWNIRQQDQGALDMARVHATTAFEKDLSYRRWTASHSVYVRLDENTSPNPYMKGIPDRDLESSGGTLTLVNPASMSRQVYELEKSSTNLRSHITALNPIRPENAPDEWERRAMLAFQRGDREVYAVDQLNDVAYMRLMRPLFTEKECLRCHLEQGYKVGDLRGGISVAVPMQPLWEVTRAHKKTLLAGHVFLWLLGLAGIGAAEIMLRRQMQSRLVAERELHQSESQIRILAERNARLDVERSLQATNQKLRLAATLQMRLLPQGMPELAGYDIAATLCPSEETAGDFYDFLVMKDGSLAIVLGDVSGHGIDAALLMSAAIGHLRVLATYCTDVGEVTTRLNQLIAEEADGHFVTLFVAQLDTEANQLTYASAGHPGYHFLDGGEIQILDSPCIPLGIRANWAFDASPASALSEGDIVVMYTDGFIEAMNGDGELYGIDRLHQSIEAHRGLPANQIVQQLRDEIDCFTGGVGQSDDMTMVIIKKG